MPLPTSVTTRLEYQHKSLIDIIDGLSDDQIRRQVVPGKWSIFENIVHLGTYQHLFLHRLNQIAAEDNPHFARYSAEADPFFHDNCTKTTREVMQHLISIRREIIEKTHGISEDAIPRKGTHPVFGELNTIQWLNFFLLHEAHHLFTIFRLAPEVRNR